MQSYMTDVSKRKRVVVTGIGTVTSHGIGADIFWDNLLAGKSGIDRITSFDPTDYPSKIGSEVRDFEISDLRFTQ